MTVEGESEWLKIMLEEIARKKAEEDQMLAEEQRRRDRGPRTAPRPDLERA